MDAITAVVALLPGDIVYLCSRSTRRAAVATVVHVTEEIVHVRPVTDYYAWDMPDPKLLPIEGALIGVSPQVIEDIRW